MVFDGCANEIHKTRRARLRAKGRSDLFLIQLGFLFFARQVFVSAEHLVENGEARSVVVVPALVVIVVEASATVEGQPIERGREVMTTVRDDRIELTQHDPAVECEQMRLQHEGREVSS